MDISALQSTLRDFAAARRWQAFHNPKNLSTALMVEAAELSEIFQWKTPEESQVAHLYPDIKERIADEVADVLLYLLQVADHSAIDVERAVANKLMKNAVKYPAATPESAPKSTGHEVVTNPGLDKPAVDDVFHTHVLVDWENVQPKDVEIQALVPGVTDVWLFHGPNQKNVSVHQSLWGQQVTLVPIARAGKNALDFHLSFYMGYIASRNPQANFVVLSNDTGYLPMLEHARTLGFSVQQMGFQKARVPARKVSEKATAELSTKAAASSASQAKPVSANVKIALPKAATPPKTAPSIKARKAPPKPSVAQKVSGGQPSAPAKKAAPVKKTPAAKKLSQAPNPGGALARAAEQQPEPTHAQSVDKGVRHVKASLKKMTSKPTREARLVAAVTSLLGDSASDVRLVNDVLGKLQGSQFVVINDQGQVTFPG